MASVDDALLGDIEGHGASVGATWNARDDWANLNFVFQGSTNFSNAELKAPPKSKPEKGLGNQ
jgi:hypothetical protein